MKALFIIFYGLEAYNGISKKIGYQLSALNKCGVDTRLSSILIEQDGTQRRMIDNDVLEELGGGICAKIKKWTDYSALTDYVHQQKTDIVYIRSYHNANPFLIHAVKQFRRSGAKVLLEIPTYPYDNEYRDASLGERAKAFVDRCFRRSLAAQLYRIVTFSNDASIFGTQTICISNGIDFDAVPLRKAVSTNRSEIHMIAVAEIHFWHGFDRIITGLAAYYASSRQIKVSIDIIGYGDEAVISRLKQMTHDLHLGEYVHFAGPKHGEELTACFEKADIGIASLGRHRSGIEQIKTLKNREYAARGIPFIYSESDSDFDDKPYILKVKPDESPIDINRLIAFYRNQPASPGEIRASISNLSWEKQMQKVVDECLAIQKQEPC